MMKKKFLNAIEKYKFLAMMNIAINNKIKLKNTK